MHHYAFQTSFPAGKIIPLVMIQELNLGGNRLDEQIKGKDNLII